MATENQTDARIQILSKPLVVRRRPAHALFPNIVGFHAEVKAKVREYVDNGCTCPILYPLGDPRLMIDIFADGYS